MSELTKEEQDRLISELTDRLVPPGPEKGRYEQMTLPEHKALGLKAVLAYHACVVNIYGFLEIMKLLKKILLK